MIEKKKKQREKRVVGIYSLSSFRLPHPNIGEIIESFDGPCYLFTILLKNFHLFKIAESVSNFYLKKFSN